ncbi:hypothetical protein Q9L58_000540 [Maublancomyces gigas]|uniref:Uncharacterized protein n=1 Tax=Discina gigas TaxID=1032678 RepID=A0ABR3GWJ0_9PEZI
MSPSVSFTSELNQPFNGSSMTTEGEVTIYVEDQRGRIGGGATDGATGRPDVRPNDNASKTYLGGWYFVVLLILYMTIGAFTKADSVGRAHRFTACGIIELKAPGSSESTPLLLQCGTLS